ncbi:hypothetical protein RFF05_12830 [Bengtsoniella intestinalis]|uniref:hypothetical protein n=1 Tax=Bengtsoniella intestinalis TaxID=3073143 RepID=UPI00391F3C1F
MTLSQQFQQALLTACQTAQAEVKGCQMTRLLQTIDKRGGVETVQELCRRGRLSDGFDALKQANRLDLSPEAIVIQKPFGTLFTDDEVNGCYDVLVECGYFG